jgi:hypothetical protein
MLTHNQRAFIRNQVEALLRFKIPETEALSVTRLQNYCKGGVYFESHLPMASGYETTIVIPDLLAESPAAGDYVSYQVRVSWCNEIQRKNTVKYGIGAKFLGKCEKPLTTGAIEMNLSECDLCDRELKWESICRIDGTRCLCLPCYKHLEKIPTGPVRDSILRFIDRNIT